MLLLSLVKDYLLNLLVVELIGHANHLLFIKIIETLNVVFPVGPGDIFLSVSIVLQK